MKTVEDIFMEDMERGSYQRVLSEDFSFIDILNEAFLSEKRKNNNTNSSGKNNSNIF